MRLTIDKVLENIAEHHWSKKTLIIAIDGHGGSGKSRLAKELAKSDPKISIVHFDDFYCSNLKNSDEDDNLPQFDWMRLERELLIPVTQDKETKYQRYDWILNELNDWIEVNPGKTTIIEGVYSLNFNLQKYYDFKIWVECPLEIRLNRAKIRDKEYNINTMDLWLNDWIPRENNYVIIQKPYKSADLIIDGSGLNADIECGELHTLDSAVLD
jgi:uridine kinase